MTITTIRNGSRVPHAVNPLRGTYRGIPTNARLWIFVWSPVARRFYPQTHQPDRPAVLANGRFRAAAFFGGAAGERYEVSAVLATPGASASITRTLRRWRVSGNYPGWLRSQVPAGIDEKHCVGVVLR